MPTNQGFLLTGLVAFSLLNEATGDQYTINTKHQFVGGLDFSNEKSFQAERGLSFVQLVLKVGEQYKGFHISKMRWIDADGSKMSVRGRVAAFFKKNY